MLEWFKKTWLGRIMFYPDPMDYKGDEVITPAPREIVKVKIPAPALVAVPVSIKAPVPMSRIPYPPAPQKTVVKRVPRSAAQQAAVDEFQASERARFQQSILDDEDTLLTDTLITAVLLDSLSQPSVVIEPAPAPYVSGMGGDFGGGGATGTYDPPAPAPEPYYEPPAPAPEPDTSWSSSPADPPSWDSGSSSSDSSWGSSWDN